MTASRRILPPKNPEYLAAFPWTRDRALPGWRHACMAVRAVGHTAGVPAGPWEVLLHERPLVRDLPPAVVPVQFDTVEEAKRFVCRNFDQFIDRARLAQIVTIDLMTRQARIIDWTALRPLELPDAPLEAAAVHAVP